jgi:3-deoxy-D-arabino-heptulosonate 7-phosphate (DAHP) synthase class II
VDRVELGTAANAARPRGHHRQPHAPLRQSPSKSRHEGKSMNALIYADEYRTLERNLDQIQHRLAMHLGVGRCLRSASAALAAERDTVTFRLMQLDDLIAYDVDLAA